MNILYADDDFDIRTLYAGLLRDEGHQVDTARHGGDAIALIESVQDGYYDLLLLDMQMPVMDGKAVLAWLERNEVRLPVIITSANVETPPGYTSVPKPFIPDRLMAAINRLAVPA